MKQQNPSNFLFFVYIQQGERFMFPKKLSAMEIKRIKLPNRSISGANKALCDLG